MKVMEIAPPIIKQGVLLVLCPAIPDLPQWVQAVFQMACFFVAHAPKLRKVVNGRMVDLAREAEW